MLRLCLLRGSLRADAPAATALVMVVLLLPQCNCIRRRLLLPLQHSLHQAASYN